MVRLDRCLAQRIHPRKRRVAARQPPDGARSALTHQLSRSEDAGTHIRFVFMARESGQLPLSGSRPERYCGG